MATDEAIAGNDEFDEGRIERAGKSMRTGSTSWCLVLSAPFKQASMLADLISEMDDLNPPAVAIHESGDPKIWVLQAYFEEQPDLNGIERHLEAHLCPASGAATCNKRLMTDWVALGAKRPVADTGRALFHPWQP